MDELIEKALSKVRDERLLMDKLIKAEEDEDYITSEALKEVFKVIFIDTNTLVEEMLSQYDQEELATHIMIGHEGLDDDTYDRTTLCFLLVNKYRDAVKESVFDEENNQYIYAVYLWFVKNFEMTEEEKESLHKFVNLRATQSSVLRQYFTGDTSKIEDLCVPEKSYGLLSNFLAERAYYGLLINVIKAANGLEMLDGIDGYTVALEGERKLLELEFTAICAEMANRGITYPMVEEQITPFTHEIIEKSSGLANKFLALRRQKN